MIMYICKVIQFRVTIKQLNIMKTTQLIVFRTFSIEVPTKKLVSEIHILADELILKHFPEYVTDGYDTLDELLKATSIKEAIYKLIADKMNLKITL